MPSTTIHPSRAPARFEPAMAQHDGLVHFIVRRQWGANLPYAERLQVGRIGLWQALQHFDPQRGTAFSTYAAVAIARQVWRAVAQAQAPPQERLTVCPPHAAPDLAADSEQRAVYACLHALIDRLPPHLRQVVILYYGLRGYPPHSLRQLGQRLGISHEMVRQRLLAALVRLRQPANSLPLRQLCGRNTIADYEYADALAQRFLRHRGGHHGHSH